MLNNRLLLGFLAFGISFGMGLITQRDFGKAVLTGITTIPATYIATGVVNRRLYQQGDDRIATLNSHIAALQHRRMEAYQQFTEIMAEKEQVAEALRSMQTQMGQFYGSSAYGSGAAAALPRAGSRANLSWDLTTGSAPQLPPEAQSQILPTEIQSPRPATAVRPPALQPQDWELNQVLSEAAATKHKIEASLQSLHGELTHLKAQAIEQRHTRDQLAQEIASLTEQKQQIGTEATVLRQEVQELDYSRQELARFIEYAEVKKQELDAGNHPLQLALKQLQIEISALHDELRALEDQVRDRRQQKEALDQYLSELNAQVLAKPPSPARPVPANGNKTSRKAPTNPPMETGSSPHPLRQLANTIAAVTLPNLPRVDLSAPAASPELPTEWTEFLQHLPDYEVQVLKAIAEQANPATIIKQIAEDNLTMPELLIDSINERALDTIGDLLVESRSSSGSAAIAPEHLKLVQKLLKTYEAF